MKFRILTHPSLKILIFFCFLLELQIQPEKMVIYQSLSSALKTPKKCEV
ncbi:hypothetical protein LEP1GSC161_1796 [Leptospira santarosai str. CBC1416]|uniref:Uncharacterized protein n=1 Tax=Leptospira santarosai str. CBC1416 TaxID=1193059 RepID=M6VMZ0_9LEPT|nr:hypothetical protein LEP1GSC071_2079 [Leptospira santarosai str. JET]EMJ49302.1 hypothetical protein LEP1GSC169_1243 [Leptospira santarosai str. HAI1349]EMO22405.1 hypothetical protein LEP1GSC168_2395 [Leptospira santarosai str. HAI134]EMO31895.1 hypothetical protein LEP1GSC175_3062 [Leptospira santarosai str. HAI821]EMO56481.1 hypothetical protein LEP1GSC161_1796 [Leptospira santarosai str. CBC1416]EMO71018.1 hypothetical protein LEP1GSC130_1220 [Leptospira santarosai str. 200403458]EMO85